MAVTHKKTTIFFKNKNCALFHFKPTPKGQFMAKYF